MNLEKVEKFVLQINGLKKDIEELNNRLEIITNMTSIKFSGRGASGAISYFFIQEDSSSPAVKAFTTLLFDEVDNLLVKKNKELSELLKKGIEV